MQIIFQDLGFEDLKECGRLQSNVVRDFTAVSVYFLTQKNVTMKAMIQVRFFEFKKTGSEKPCK